MPLDVEQLGAFRRLLGDRWVGQPVVDWEHLVDGGRQLAVLALPPPVYALLTQSLMHIPPDNGLRIRLCLDKALVDLPWEYLYRPDAFGQELKNFLALDARISIVREAPRFTHKARPSRRRQRLLFAGTPFWVNGSDRWQVEEERQQLLHALEPVHELLTVQCIGAPQIVLRGDSLGAQIDISIIWPHRHHRGKGASLEELRTDLVCVDAKYIPCENSEYRGSYAVPSAED